MLCLILFILILLANLYIGLRSKGLHKDELAGLSSKDYPLKGMLPIGLWLLNSINYKHSTAYESKLRLKLAELHGKGKANFYLRLNVANKICLSVLIILMFLFYGSLCWIQDFIEAGAISSVVVSDGRLSRPEFGNGNAIVDANAIVSYGKEERIFSYKILLKEKPPKNDLEAITRACELLTEGLIKNKNLNLSSVYGNLLLKSTYPSLKHLDVNIDWHSSDIEYIKPDGTVSLPLKGQASKNIALIAVISKNGFKKEKVFELILKPQELTGEELSIDAAKHELDSYMKELNSSAQSEDFVALPTDLQENNGVSIAWASGAAVKRDLVSETGISYIALAVMCTLAIFFIYDSEINKKISMRRRSIQCEFPGFLTKLLLLVNAGMNIGRAWDKIALDQKEDSILVVELRKTMLEIKGGIPELQAYEHFAQRCALPEVSKFVSILIQNIRKGSSELVQLLRILNRECWENRKSISRKYGEEASTKLLLPMMLMLVGILIIVATPAFISINSFGR